MGKTATSDPPGRPARGEQPGSLDRLTARERQVVVSAALGRTNKEIAYTLGIGHSTARVLLARAFRRLGVSSRAEFLALPIVQTLMRPPES
jgi:DNA-binding CsgD family transcriptional regulator